ncbi:MAG: hypothetical protein WCX16_04200 [Candidatus Omnitrophota bacterium]
MKKYLKKKHAFTFVEILLGFLIFSVVTLVLVSTFFSGLKIQQRANDDGAMYHQVKMALDMMTQELEQAIFFDLSNLAPNLKSFEATAKQISFLIADKNGGIKRISYYLEDKEKIHIYKTLLGQHYEKNVSVVDIKSEKIPSVAFMRSEEAFVDFVSTKRSPTIQQEVLLDNVQRDSLKFSYAYLQPAEEKASLSWQGVWDKEYIPAGVRFEMILVPLKKKEALVTIKKDVYIPTGFWGEPS